MAPRLQNNESSQANSPRSVPRSFGASCSVPNNAIISHRFPVEITRMIWDIFLAMLPPENQLQVNTLHPLTLVSKTYYEVFNPLLFERVVLITAEAKQSFQKHTARNSELCDLAQTLVYSDCESPEHIVRPSWDLDRLLHRLRNIRVLEILGHVWLQNSRIPERKKLYTERFWFPRLKNLGTIVFCDTGNVLPLLSEALWFLLPQIEHLSLEVTNVFLYPAGGPTVEMRALKSLEVYGGECEFLDSLLRYISRPEECKLLWNEEKYSRTGV
jgi:hypothetical protein